MNGKEGEEVGMSFPAWHCLARNPLQPPFTERLVASQASRALLKSGTRMECDGKGFFHHSAQMKPNPGATFPRSCSGVSPEKGVNHAHRKCQRKQHLHSHFPAGRKGRRTGCEK